MRLLYAPVIFEHALLIRHHPYCVRPLQVNNEVDNPSIHLPAKGAEQIRQQDPRTQPLRQAHVEHDVEANPGHIRPSSSTLEGREPVLFPTSMHQKPIIPKGSTHPHLL